MPVYKYVTSDRVDILINSHIRFTQPGAFNDPFESYPNFKSIITNELAEETIKNYNQDDSNIEKLIKEQYEKESLNKKGISYDIFRNNLKETLDNAMPFLEDFYKDLMVMQKPSYKSKITEMLLSSINKEIGILSLTETRDNLLMWAHYTHNHTGFVIEFNDGHSFFDQRTNDDEIRGKLMKVRYSIKRPEVTLYDPNLSNEEQKDLWIRDIFWVKSKHWEYEQEWRMILTLRDCNNVINSDPMNIHLFPIPKECINCIVIGCKASDDTKKIIISILKKDSQLSNIKLLQAKMNDLKYKLDFIEV